MTTIIKKGRITIIPLVILCIIIIFSFLSKAKTGTYNNPIVYFNFWWGGWLFISYFGLLGIDVPNIRTYLIVMLYMVLFSIGCLLIIKRVNPIQNSLKKELTKSSEYKLKTLNIIQLFILLILIPFVIKAIPNILNMEASTYRTAIYSTNILYSSNTIERAFDYIIQPMIVTGLLLGGLSTLLGFKYRKLFIISVLNAILYSIMTLGRWYFLRIIAFLLLGYLLLILTRKTNLNKKVLRSNKRLLLVLLPVGFIAILVSSFRANNTNSILYTFYEYVVRYFTGSFVALDRFLNDYYSNTMSNYYGRVTFAGLEEFFVFVIRRFDTSVENLKSTISFYTNEFINIGGGYSYNAFYTSIYNHYLDGGILFLVLFTIIFGTTVGVIYNYYISKPNLFSISLLVFIIYISLIATLRWEFYYPMTWIVVLNLLLLNTKLGKSDKSRV